MIDREILNSLVNQLGEKKTPFLQGLSSDVKEYVSSKTTEHCLGLRLIPLLSEYGYDPVLYPSLNPFELASYVSRLIPFLLKSNYKKHGSEYKIDSVLTNEVVDIVSKKYQQFYKENQDIISDHVIISIATQKDISDVFFQTIVDNNSATKFASQEIKGHIVDFLKHSLHAKLQEMSSKLGHSAIAIVHKALANSLVSSVLTNISLIIGKVAAASITKTIGAIVVKNTAIYVSHNLGIILAKVMAVPAIKAFITKFVLAAILAGFIKVIVVSTGASIGTVLLVILIPILVAFIANEWIHLPKKLGDAISGSIGGELATNFSTTNNQIVSELFEQFIGDKGRSLGLSMANDDELTKELMKLLPDIERLIKF
jgi:hypothetical protein